MKYAKDIFSDEETETLGPDEVPRSKWKNTALWVLVVVMWVIFITGQIQPSVLS